MAMTTMEDDKHEDSATAHFKKIESAHPIRDVLMREVESLNEEQCRTILEKALWVKSMRQQKKVI